MAETILVIEDERLTRNNLISFLLSEGFETLDASNGRVGIELAKVHLPDLIICDILMPELDGYDVLISLQQQSQTATIPFIFLTVSATEDGFRQGLALGADDYLSKPVTSDQLRAAIAAQLRKSKPALVSVPEPVPDVLIAEMSPQGYSDSWPSVTTLPPTQTHSTTVELAKAQLLETLCPVLRQRLINLRGAIEELQSLAPEKVASQKLRDEFVQMLSLINEVSALQKSFTPANATDLLRVFSTMVKDIEENE